VNEIKVGRNQTEMDKRDKSVCVFACRRHIVHSDCFVLKSTSFVKPKNTMKISEQRNEIKEAGFVEQISNPDTNSVMMWIEIVCVSWDVMHG